MGEIRDKREVPMNKGQGGAVISVVVSKDRDNYPNHRVNTNIMRPKLEAPN